MRNYLPEVLIRVPGMRVPAFVANEVISRRRRGLTDDEQYAREVRGTEFVEAHAPICGQCHTVKVPGFGWLHRDCREFEATAPGYLCACTDAIESEAENVLKTNPLWFLELTGHMD